MIQGLNDISSSPILRRAMAELPRGITDRPALVLVKLGNEILARAEDPLAALGLRGRQYLLRAVLGTDAPPSQLELAGLCGLLPAQVVPVLDELERRGLVARQRSEADPRRPGGRRTPGGGGRRAAGARWSGARRPVRRASRRRTSSPARSRTPCSASSAPARASSSTARS